MKPPTQSGALARAVCAAAVAAACCKPAEGEKATPADPPAPVETAAVAAEEAKVVIEASGTVEAVSDVTVVAEAAGKVKKVLFEMGDDVEEGQPLVRLDRRFQSLAVQQAKAQLAQASAARDMAVLQEDRTRKLVDQGSASQVELDKAVMDMKAATAAFDLATVGVKNAKELLATTTIKAPIAGRVTYSLVTRGQMLGQGSPVAQITDLSALKVTVGLTEREVADLVVGQEVEVSASVKTDVRATGAIAGIGFKAVGPTRAFPVEIRIDSPDPRLHPGMTVGLRIVVAEIESAILVHVNDIQEKDGKSFVWVADKGRASRREVVTGRQIGERLEVTSGLSAGECLVVRGGDLLRDGAPLKISPPEPGDDSKPCGG